MNTPSKNICLLGGTAEQARGQIARRRQKREGHLRLEAILRNQPFDQEKKQG
jgi:hypothetical protein